MFATKNFTPAQGRIDISGSVLKDGALELIVKDSGISISEQDSEKVLQLLSQTSSGLVRSSEGIGLGLSISKSFAEHHNGTLQIESGLNLEVSIIIKNSGNASRFLIAVRTALRLHSGLETLHQHEIGGSQ